MGKIEFDKKTGKLILPPSILKDKEEESQGIVFTKVQVNVNNPAIAQLKVKIGEKLDNSEEILKKIKDLSKKFIDLRQSSVEAKIIPSERLLIVEARSSWKMYSFLSELASYLRENLNDYKILVRGSWAKGDPFLE